MNSRFATLAAAALALSLIPSVGISQGNSGKTRLTICHVPPGNPDAQRTMAIPEPAWGAHESHGDILGPCDGYDGEASDSHEDGVDPAKKVKKKDRKKYRDGSDGDDSDDESHDRDRVRKRRHDDQADSESDETDSESDATEAESAGRREKRGAERKSRKPSDAISDDGQAADTTETTPSENAGEVGAGGADPGTEDSTQAEERGERQSRTEGRSKRGSQKNADTGDAAEEEQGFFRGMRRFFGFGEEGAEPSAE